MLSYHENPIELYLRLPTIACILLLQGNILLLGLYYELYYNPQQSERAQFYFIATFMLMAMLVQAVVIIFMENCCQLTSSFFTFTEVLSNLILSYMFVNRNNSYKLCLTDGFHKIGPNYKD